LIFKDIEDLIWENDVLFLNNSKVIKARIKWNLEINNEDPETSSGWQSVNLEWQNTSCHAEFSSASQEYIDPETSLRWQSSEWQEKNIVFKFISQDWTVFECNKCEIFFLKELWDNQFEALVYPWKKFKVWKQIDINGYKFEVIWNTEEWRVIKYLWKEFVIDVFDKLWNMPLPPYIEYKKEKEAAYQPVFAQTAWSVAAPTASLHFTDDLLEKLEKKWVKKLYSTLHIWLGTFKVVDVENIENYDIHSETWIFFKNFENLKKTEKI